MTPAPKAPRYVLVPLREVLDDIAALAELGTDVIEAATTALDDLAHGRVIGKELGDRNVSGDLTGLARVKFDVIGQRPQRFRLIYRQVDASTREIVAIGPRGRTCDLPSRGDPPATQSWPRDRSVTPNVTPSRGHHRE